MKNNNNLKFLTLSLSLVFLLLSGCKNESEQLNNDIFLKKQECVAYKEKIIKEVRNKPGIFHEMFYSPHLNSCIYVYANYTGQRYIVDYFTDEILMSANFNDEELTNFSLKINELKN